MPELCYSEKTHVLLYQVHMCNMCVGMGAVMLPIS